MKENIKKTTDWINQTKSNIFHNYILKTSEKTSSGYINNNNNYYMMLLSFFAGYQFRYYIQYKIT